MSKRLVLVLLLSSCTKPAPIAPPVAPPDALAALDQRTSVPMEASMAWHQKQNMMDHLVAIEEIVSSAAEDDWARATQAAERIASSAQMQESCERMGAHAVGFTELALSFHQEADRIVAATKARDQRAALRATGRTLRVCTSCHASFRQEVVAKIDPWTSGKTAN